MARTNKYASLNFNDIYDKKINNKKPINNNNPSPSSSIHNKTKITNSRIHGNMLVLTRPTPKPISSLTQTQTPPPPPPQHQQQPKHPDPTPPASNSDSISLRPLGSTGGSACVSGGVSGLPRDLCFVSPKPDKFVPPHLRPGYVCKEEKPVSPVKNTGGYRQRQFQFGEESARPKSGGGVGYDRMRRATTGPDFVFRPGSGGNNRPNSTG